MKKDNGYVKNKINEVVFSTNNQVFNYERSGKELNFNQYVISFELSIVSLDFLIIFLWKTIL
jgi:hypothetical protein